MGSVVELKGRIEEWPPPTRRKLVGLSTEKSPIQSGMHKKPFALSALVVFAITAAPLNGEDAPPSRWSWQESQAKVDPRGDLKWNPRPFVFEKRASVRYIDFEAGNDANSGDATETAWKHHPWDPAAAG